MIEQLRTKADEATIPAYVGCMSDVLEGGPRRSGPPRWLGVVAGIVALVAVATYAAANRHQTGVPTPDRSPTGGLASAVSPSPFAAGACGAAAFRPLMRPQPLAERIGVQVLVGGYGVRLVDSDRGTARPVSGIPMDAQHTVSEMASVAGVTYVLSVACDGGAGRVYRLDDNEGRSIAGPPVGDLLAGPDRVWAVEYPDAAAAPTAPVVLRPLNGGRALALQSGAYPVADTGPGVVVSVGGPGRQPTVLLLDPTSGRPVRTLGVGVPLAVDGIHVLSQVGPCDFNQATPSCTVARVDLRTGQVHGRYNLPKGRVPVSAGSVSRDGRLVVFQLARAIATPGSISGTRSRRPTSSCSTWTPVDSRSSRTSH